MDSPMDKVTKRIFGLSAGRGPLVGSLPALMLRTSIGSMVWWGAALDPGGLTSRVCLPGRSYGGYFGVPRPVE
jgi:hypothetical protein